VPSRKLSFELHKVIFNSSLVNQGWSSMEKGKLIVVGDRVLVTPDEGEERTKVGLYLPQTVTDKQSV